MQQFAFKILCIEVTAWNRTVNFLNANGCRATRQVLPLLSFALRASVQQTMSLLTRCEVRIYLKILTIVKLDDSLDRGGTDA